MAALRHGIKTVIIPRDNEKDLREIDQTVCKALNFILVEHVDAVIDAALDLPLSAMTAQKPKSEERKLPVAHEPTQINQGIRQ